MLNARAYGVTGREIHVGAGHVHTNRTRGYEQTKRTGQRAMLGKGAAVHTLLVLAALHFAPPPPDTGVPPSRAWKLQPPTCAAVASRLSCWLSMKPARHAAPMNALL